MSYPSWSPRLGHLTALAGLTVVGDAHGLRREAEAAQRQRVPRAELREAVTVASLFGGFPRAVAAQGILNEVLGPPAEKARQAWGVDRQATPADLRRRGEEVFRSIHGRRAGPQLTMLRGLPGVFSHGIFVEAYGRVMAREVFDLQTIELLAVSCLSVLDLPRVLRAHLLAAKGLGAAPELLQTVVLHVAESCGRDPEDSLKLVQRAAGSGSEHFRSPDP